MIPQAAAAVATAPLPFPHASATSKVSRAALVGRPLVFILRRLLALDASSSVGSDAGRGRRGDENRSYAEDISDMSLCFIDGTGALTTASPPSVDAQPGGCGSPCEVGV